MDMSAPVKASAAPKTAKAPAKAKPKPPAVELPTKTPPAKETAPAKKSGPDPITPSDIGDGIKSGYARVPESDAKGTILTAVVLTAGSALISQLVHPKPGGVRPFAKIIVGGFLMGAFLTLIAEADPRVAKALAWVTTISAVLINGQTLFGVVNSTVSPGSAKAVAKPGNFSFGGGSFGPTDNKPKPKPAPQTHSQN